MAQLVLLDDDFDTLPSVVAEGRRVLGSLPGFLLALGPNRRPFRPGLLRRVLTRPVLAGTVTAAAVLLTYAGARQERVAGDTARTAAIIVTVVVTLWVLAMMARPLTAGRPVLIVAMAGVFLAAYLTP